MDKVRVANAQGFWGDFQDAALRQLEGGPVDYIVMDYLAEVTMAIMRKLKSRNPSAGYATDFVSVVEGILPQLLEKDVKLITNAGGMNPYECRNQVLQVAKRMGIKDLKIGVVTGDDILSQIDDLQEKGVSLENIDTGEDFEKIEDGVTCANVYLGATPIVEALEGGAQIVITGRCTDPALILAPLMYEFDWAEDDWDRLAAGTVAGHIIECGVQATGGNFLGDWQSIDFSNIGFPIAEVSSNGEFVITKHEGTGGIVSEETVKEQILYELGDPQNYISTDVIVDFTSLQLEEVGKDRVKVYGVEGKPPTDTYKVSMNYTDGYMAAGTITYSGPDALDKARVGDELLRERFEILELELDEIRSEFLGYNGCHEAIDDNGLEPNEVVLRVAVRSKNKDDLKLFGKEFAPLILAGPPSVAGIKGRPRPREVLAFWPTLVSKSEVLPEVSVEEGE